MTSERRPRPLRHVKDEIRVLAIKATETTPTWALGVVYRGRYWLDGVMKTQLSPKGLDATGDLVEMIRGSPHYDQIRVIILDDVTLGGRKFVDIRRLYEETLKPVILLMEEPPPEKALESLGEGVRLRLEGWEGRMWLAGVSSRVAERVVRKARGDEGVPEALRVAELLSSAFLQLQGRRNILQERQKV